MDLHKKYFLLIFTVSFTLNSFAQNILISDSLLPNEPSIMMDPNNTDILVAGTNLNSVYRSIDGGLNWTTETLTSPLGVWGDPVIDVDTAGNFYFFHLSNPPTGDWIDRIVCQKSTDNGQSWSMGTSTGLNQSKEQDKQWSVVDRTNNTIYLTWTQFDNYGSNAPSDSSTILFSKSTDEGATWSSPLRINKLAGDCVDKDSTVEGAVPAIGPNGEIYVSWAGPNGIVFNRSEDEGATWLSQEILVDSMPNGWDFDIPGIYRANGLPITKCDLSGGPNHGTIYVNWSDQRNGSDDTDIWLSKSTDGGNTWTGPTRVNNDESNNHQFFTWMDIDQTNGNLYFVFYDRRNYSDTRTDVYLAASTDGGTNFINKQISDSSFIPNEDVFFGDYINITAHNNIVRPIWTRLHDGHLSLWTDMTDVSEILSVEEELVDKSENNLHQYPNPTTNISYVSFKLHELSNITLELTDQQGKVVHTEINNEKMEYGKYVIPIQLDELNLPSGTYYHRLFVNEKSKSVKTVIIK